MIYYIEDILKFKGIYKGTDNQGYLNFGNCSFEITDSFKLNQKGLITSG